MLTRLHPLTGRPLEPIGVFRGRVVWPIMGGSEGATEAPPAAPPAGAPPAGTPTPPPAGAGAPPAAPDPAAEVSDDDAAAMKAEELAAKYTPAKLAAYALAKAKEAGDNRVKGKTAADTAAEAARTAAIEALKPAMIAAGLIPADAPTDAAALAKQLEEATSGREAALVEARTNRIELEVLRNAGNAGLVADIGGAIDGDKILNSRRFANAVASLDPTAADFGAKIVAAMKDEATKDPSVKVTRAVTRAGVPLTGGSGERPRSTAPTSLADGVAAHYATNG